MATTILRAYNQNGVKYDLDLFNDEAFLLDISTIESGDIGEVFGISSQTFALPATNNNNEYFGNLYDLGAVPASSFTKTFACQVLSDGDEIFSGNIYLDSVVTDNNGDTIYNVNVVNEVVDFKYQIIDKTFGNLDWSEYNHDLNYTNISSSWDLDLFGGDVVYPLVEYGVEQNADPTGSYAPTLIKNGAEVNTFTHPDYPLTPIDFKPAIRLGTLMTKIFDSVNYKYTSSFFDSSYAQSIYVLATQDETRTAGSFVSPVSQSVTANSTSPQSITTNAVATKVIYDAEIWDPSNRWDTATSEFTAGTPGQYSFSTDIDFEFTNLQDNTNRSINLFLYLNGVLIPNSQRFFNFSTGYTPSSYTGFISANWVNVPLLSGDVLELRASYTSTQPSELCDFTFGWFQCYQAPMSYAGGNVDLGACFNPQEKLTDFLNGVIQKFNLVIEPLEENPTIMSIETFNTWRDNGKIVDWTDKVDRSIKWEIKHPLSSVPRDLYFSDEDDVDYFNQYYTSRTNTIFGDKRYFSESDLADGERRIGSYFASTPMRYIDNTNTFIVPQIYTAEGPLELKKRFKFKPRLFHYLGKFPNTNLPNGLGFPTNVWYFENEALTSVSQSDHPVFHHLSQLPAQTIPPTTEALDLNFGNLNHWEYHQPYVNAQTEQDAFYTYWAEYVNELYDVESRLVTMNVLLTPTDIPNIRLNDKIFIDGHYYRINKIQGANLTDKESTNVELIKVLTQKLKYPRRRINIGTLPGEYQDVRVKNLNLGGRVEYVDFETGELITDADLLSQAGNRDGFRYFSGSNEVVWQQQRGVSLSNNLISGVNYVDDRVSNALVIGSGNVVGPSVLGATIHGDKNSLMEGIGNISIFGNNVEFSGSVTNAFVVNQTGSATIIDTHDIIALNPVRPVNGYDYNKVVIGNSLNQGAQYETYNNILASAGAVFYLTGSETADRFHYHFSWTGSNGTATVYINDATNPEYDGQLQRFTTDETLTASNIVNLTPISGTIDGNTEEPLTVPYDGMTAQIINGEWIVVQRKK